MVKDRGGIIGCVGKVERAPVTGTGLGGRAILARVAPRPVILDRRKDDGVAHRARGDQRTTHNHVLVVTKFDHGPRCQGERVAELNDQILGGDIAHVGIPGAVADCAVDGDAIGVVAIEGVIAKVGEAVAFQMHRAALVVDDGIVVHRGGAAIFDGKGMAAMVAQLIAADLAARTIKPLQAIGSAVTHHRISQVEIDAFDRNCRTTICCDGAAIKHVHMTHDAAATGAIERQPIPITGIRPCSGAIIVAVIAGRIVMNGGKDNRLFGCALSREHAVDHQPSPRIAG